jgi:hypothetical protein
VAKFEAVFQQLPEGTEENYERPQSKLPMSGPGFELGTFLIYSKSHRITVFWTFPSSGILETTQPDVGKVKKKKKKQ